MAPSVEKDEERKFHSLEATTPQSLADAHCLSALQ